jgi:hypothetical protein
VEIAGEGTDWASRIYVFSLVTEAFEMGLTRCVVGTRGISSARAGTRLR